jgi:hypothetical protein
MDKNCLCIYAIPLSFIAFHLSRVAMGMYITNQGTKKEKFIISIFATTAVGGSIYGLIKCFY